jgi:hypothetical protein
LLNGVEHRGETGHRLLIGVAKKSRRQRFTNPGAWALA